MSCIVAKKNLYVIVLNFSFLAFEIVASQNIHFFRSHLSHPHKKKSSMTLHEMIYEIILVY